MGLDRLSTSVDLHERDVEFVEVRISLWHDGSAMSENLFLGEIRLPVRLDSHAW